VYQVGINKGMVLHVITDIISWYIYNIFVKM